MKQLRTFIMLLVTSNLFLACEKKTTNPETITEAVANIVQPYVALGGDVGVIVGGTAVVAFDCNMVFKFSYFGKNFPVL